jgi:hypothetical protein
MAKPKQRAAYSLTSDIDRFQLELTDTEWKSLEKEYRHPISVAARADLLSECNSFFHQIQYEQNAIALDDISKIAKYWMEQIEDFLKLTYGVYPEGSFNPEEISEFEYRLGAFFEEYPHRFGGDDIVIQEDMPDEVKNYLEQNSIAIKFRIAKIEQIIWRLHTGLLAIKLQNNFTSWMDNETGFKDGQAWAYFLFDSVNWAKKHNLPSDYEKSRGNASDFAYMLFELRKHFPEKFRRNPVKNANALAEQMGKKIREINKKNETSAK